jgi:hypothetical protein
MPKLFRKQGRFRCRAKHPRGTYRCGFWRSPSLATRNPVRQTGSRPTAPKNLGFASAYVFGAVCPSEGKAAALIMPICNTVAMNHHLHEISSQVADNAHAMAIRDGAGWHRNPRTGGARQYHFVRAAFFQPGAQPGRADLALSARSARSLGRWLRPLHRWYRLSKP